LSSSCRNADREREERGRRESLFAPRNKGGKISSAPFGSLLFKGLGTSYDGSPFLNEEKNCEDSSLPAFLEESKFPTVKKDRPSIVEAIKKYGG